MVGPIEKVPIKEVAGVMAVQGPAPTLSSSVAGLQVAPPPTTLGWVHIKSAVQTPGSVFLSKSPRQAVMVGGD